MALMLTAAACIVTFTKIDASQIANAATFKSGMSACVCVLGVAWLGDTFVSAHIGEIKEFSASILEQYPWMLAVVLFFASMLLYSQGATTTRIDACSTCDWRCTYYGGGFFCCCKCAVCITNLPDIACRGRDG